MLKPKAVLAIAAAACVAAFFVAKQIHSADPPSSKEGPKPVYSVSDYDPKRDPAKDLADTVSIAQKDDRRILLLVGGDW
jgi:hypothetical protein